MPHNPTDCQRLEAWYESQTEETLCDLFDRFGAVSPRECWHAFFNDCPPPAHEGLGDCLAAPAEAGHGVCTVHPEKTGLDKMLDNGFILAKGAGPGIWNRWVTHVCGYRVFWSRVNRGYLA